MTDPRAEVEAREDAIDRALLYTFQLSNKDYAKMRTALSATAFVRALEQDGFILARPAPPSEGLLSDAVKRAGLYEIADAMVYAILDGTFADAKEEQVRHAVYELVGKALIDGGPEARPAPPSEGPDEPVTALAERLYAAETDPLVWSRTGVTEYRDRATAIFSMAQRHNVDERPGLGAHRGPLPDESLTYPCGECGQDWPCDAHIIGDALVAVLSADR